MRNHPFILLSALMLTASCSQTPQKESQNDLQKVIGRHTMILEHRRMTPEALWAMGRLGETAVSPDGHTVAYTVTYYSVEQNRSGSQIYLLDRQGNSTPLTCDNVGRSNLAFSLDSGFLYYLSSRDGSSQIWRMDLKTGKERRLTDFGKDIEGFILSPDQSQVVLICQVSTRPSTQDLYPDLDKTSGFLADDLMYRHWDEYVTSVPHPFLSAFSADGLGPVQTDLLEGTAYESPLKPFGGIEQIAWSPDQTQIAYTCKASTGTAYALSTDSDIYVYSIPDGKTRNLTQDNSGYDTNPAFSPDGRLLAWQSMARDGYESDQNRLMVLDLESGQKTFVSQGLESNCDGFIWNRDSQSLFFTAVWHGTEQIYQCGVQGGEVRKLTQGTWDYGSVMLWGDELLANRQSMSMGSELFLVDPGNEDQSGNALQITHENQHLYDQMDFGKVEERWMRTSDGKDMLTWVIYPPEFDPSQKYPTLLYCEGGPQSPVSQFWSYRWNFQIMAANGYIVVAPNRRGLPGFGNEWNEQISGDYTGQCMRDYLTAIDEMCKEPFVDRDHLGCVGASFGGFSVYWLAGNHDGRFKAFIAHDGIFNMESQYLATEEMWFANWDMGGAYWEKDNEAAQRTFRNSPHRFVDRWDTPILCIHGMKDYRILANQATEAFAAARLRGLDAELLLFEDENHWVLKPQNGILWQRTFFRWLDRYLK